jgi:hypothetical protein
MAKTSEPETRLEVHDPAILDQARVVLDACRSLEEMQETVLAAVARNEEWRGKRCLNLLAPEAPTSPTVRTLLSSEIGTRAAEGHIGAANRWFVGTQHIDEVEALCVKRKKGRSASKKQRRANATHSKWSFAELQSMIVYKALLQGSMAVKVDAHYTSKAYPVCGHTADANRPNKGLLFVCQNCHYILHADLVGARNITMRTLLVQQDWASTGVLSERPDVSSAEAKAARLQRYAELRWSLDTSPLL